MTRTTTAEWVRDPVEITLADGRFYATERLITRTEDWREFQGVGWVNCGEVDMGWRTVRPVEGSVSEADLYLACVRPARRPLPNLLDFAGRPLISLLMVLAAAVFIFADLAG